MAVVNSKSLQERAALLFKDNVRMQEKWLEAVSKCRNTKRGWLLENQVVKIVDLTKE